jgi:NAD(P)-dependent dehydrogenase (short-subunit alcohol dehydrogenase family)
MENVLLTGINNEFDEKLAEAFRREGYRVFTPDDAERAERLDIYIDTADARDAADIGDVRTGLDEAVMRRVFEANVLLPMRALETFLPLLDAGEGKRLCFLTSAEASINETRGATGYAYKLSKAAMSNFFQMISNKLTPAGYTFRVYDPLKGGLAPELSAEAAFNYFTRRRGTENNDPLRDDETRLVFRDALGREHTW